MMRVAIIRSVPFTRFITYSNVKQKYTKHFKWLTLLVCVSALVFILTDCNLNVFENVLDLCNEPSRSQNFEWNLEMHKVCHCPRAKRPQFVPLPPSGDNLESSCSDHATARGLGQKVVSYSFYGSVASKYFIGTEYNLKAVKQMYPGWVMRLYHNINMEDPKERKVLCEIWCKNDHFDICDVYNLPSKLGNQSKTFGMLWRLFVLGDSLVDIFLVRDLDSMIIQREVDAVNEWLTDKNKYTWHTMRDNKVHSVPILGGMWGGMNRNIELTTSLRQKFIADGQKWQKGYDQTLLTKHIWPHAKQDMVSHDSYLCKKFQGAQPWPTKRNGVEFVGDSFPWPPRKKVLPTCPKECRPKNHQDWIYC